MNKEYFNAANKIMDLAKQCKDPEVISILRQGSAKIFKLGQEHSFKKEERSEILEEATGTE